MWAERESMQGRGGSWRVIDTGVQSLHHITADMQRVSRRGMMEWLLMIFGISFGHQHRQETDNKIREM
jgi:hypothetical protein